MAPFMLRWGIIGAGGISTTFATDLLLDPASRGETGVQHQVVAVAARSVARAEGFIETVLKGDPKAKAYGSYDELVADPNVDCVYVGTTHPEHFVPAKKALEAGKNVLCEKPFTVTLKNTEALLALAKEKGVFLMEAVWTRYQPLVKEIERVVRDDKLIGDVRRVYADLGFDAGLDTLPGDSRMISPALAGGGLLDLGPYPMLWALLICAGPEAKAPSSIASSIQFTDLPQIDSQVDKNTTWVLNWDDEGTQAVCTTSIASETSYSAVVIQGLKGEITIPHPAFRPTSYTISLRTGETDITTGDGTGPPLDTKTVTAEIEGRGMHWMADEVARCIRDGKTESERMPHATTRLAMSIFDTVRQQNGFRLPMDD